MKTMFDAGQQRKRMFYARTTEKKDVWRKDNREKGCLTQGKQRKRMFDPRTKEEMFDPKTTDLILTLALHF